MEVGRVKIAGLGLGKRFQFLWGKILVTAGLTLVDELLLF